MAYCVSCGALIDDDSVFCSKCGRSVRSNENRTKDTSVHNPENIEEFEGKLKKCPGCGSIVKSFSVFCEACGLEFRDTKVSSRIGEFEKQYQSTQSPSAKASLIQSFMVPNTKEDIYEFILLAASNIDPEEYGRACMANKDPMSLNPLRKTYVVQNAWLSKLEHTYNKAKLCFGTESDFPHISSVAESKLAEVEKTKLKQERSSKNKSIALAIIGCFLFVFIIVMALVFS